MPRIAVNPCENCRLQITALNESYDLNVKVTGLSDVVANQLIGRDIAASFEGGQPEEPESEDYKVCGTVGEDIANIRI